MDLHTKSFIHASAANLRALPQQLEESTKELKADLKKLLDYCDCKGVLPESEIAKTLATEQDSVVLERIELEEKRRKLENEKAEFEALATERKKLEDKKKFFSAISRDSNKIAQIGKNNILQKIQSKRNSGKSTPETKRG